MEAKDLSSAARKLFLCRPASWNLCRPAEITLRVVVLRKDLWNLYCRTKSFPDQSSSPWHDDDDDDDDDDVTILNIDKQKTSGRSEGNIEQNIEQNENHRANIERNKRKLRNDED